MGDLTLDRKRDRCPDDQAVTPPSAGPKADLWNSRLLDKYGLSEDGYLDAFGDGASLLAEEDEACTPELELDAKSKAALELFDKEQSEVEHDPRRQDRGMLHGLMSFLTSGEDGGSATDPATIESFRQMVLDGHTDEALKAFADYGKHRQSDLQAFSDHEEALGGNALGTRNALRTGGKLLLAGAAVGTGVAAAPLIAGSAMGGSAIGGMLPGLGMLTGGVELGAGLTAGYGSYLGYDGAASSLTGEQPAWERGADRFWESLGGAPGALLAATTGELGLGYALGAVGQTVVGGTVEELARILGSSDDGAKEAGDFVQTGVGVADLGSGAKDLFNAGVSADVLGPLLASVTGGDSSGLLNGVLSQIAQDPSLITSAADLVDSAVQGEPSSAMSEFTK